jgi:hypothetical protein
MDTSHKGIPHRVPARNESRLLIRVEVIPQNGCDIGGQHVKQGTHDVIIYAGQLAETKALVRTEQAKADWARALRAYANHIAELVKGKDEAQRARLLAEDWQSPQAMMAVDPAYKGGFGKLESCEVIEEVSAPPTLENLQASGNAVLAEAITKAVSAGHGAIPTPEQIDERIKSGIAAGLAALEEKIAARYRTK